MLEDIRTQFSILDQQVHNNKLVYLDNAASTQKPDCVLNAVDNYYKTINSNVHRGVHLLSQLATMEYENARKKVQQFIHAKHHYEIVFTRGTTESINLVAATFGRKFFSKDDEIIISAMEHHSNIVPWQLIAEQVGAKLKIVPITSQGEIEIEAYKNLFSEKTKIVSITHVSNVLGGERYAFCRHLAP